MKIAVTIFLIFLSFSFKAQNREEITASIKYNIKHFDEIRSAYFDQVFNNDYFIYVRKKGHFRTFIDREKYNSLIKKNIPDSLVIENSMFSLAAGNEGQYIYEMKALDGSSNYLYRYKNDRIIEKYSWGKDALERYSFDDFINLISFTVVRDAESSINSVDYTQYSKMHPEYDYGFSDFIYRMTYNSEGKYSEWFPLQDFTMTEKQVFNYLLANFLKESIVLMTDIKYGRKYGDPVKKFDHDDAKYELSIIKRKIEEKIKAQKGFYNDKDYVTMYRALNGIVIEKRYSDGDNDPFYYIATAYDNKSWKFYMNPKTGKIFRILFNFVVDG